VEKNVIPATSRLTTGRALRTESREDEVVAPDAIAGALFEQARVGLDGTALHCFHGAAAIADEMVVVIAGGLVTGLTVAEVDFARHAVALETLSCTKD
jgi:hypothetical protein